jgi:hypothetical protein
LHRLTENQDPAGFGRRHAKDGLRQFAAPGADQAGEAQDFAGTHGQADTFRHRPPYQIPHFQHRRADRHGDLGEQTFDLAADHHLDQFRR